MIVALISPKGPLYRHKSGIFKKSLRAAPLTFSTLASLIPKDFDTELKIIDEGIEEIPDSLEADLVGMTVITGTAPRAYELSHRFRKEGKTVVLGGPHITLAPEEAQEHADCVVVGYAEETWPQLLRDFQKGRLKPRYDMAPDFSFDSKEELAFPRRDLMKSIGYVTTNTFEATRGCIHSCNFCVVPSAWGRKPFQKPIEHVVSDIKQSRAKKLIFYDLNLVADINYAKALFRALIPLRIKWYGLSTVLLDRDDELLELVARSGCRGLLIGFESVSRSSLRDSNKRFNNPDTYGRLIKKLHSLGITINGTFVFGNDSDNTQTFNETVDFILENGIDLPRFSILTPFPDTPLHRKLEGENRILTKDWSLYDGQHVVHQPLQMTSSELLEGHEFAWKKAYAASSIAKRCISSLKDRLASLPIIASANIGYRYYAYNLSRFYTCNGGSA